MAVGFGEDALEIEARQQRFSQCFGDSIAVGFNYRDGSGSRGYVSRQGLAKALRPDISDLLLAGHRHRAIDVKELFKVIYNPSLMFDFEPFRTLFASEIIPAQILGKRSPIFFNPAHLTIFGTP